MIDRRTCVALAISFWTALAHAASPQDVATQSPITISPNVRVSLQHPDRGHTEILAAADPENAGRLLVCTMLWSGERSALSTGIYASFDGGRSWTLTKDDTTTQNVWDPACIYGLGGIALFATIPTSDESRAQDAILIYRSADGGRTWSQPTRLPFIDREYLTIDRTGGKYHGRIYLHANGEPGRPAEPPPAPSDPSQPREPSRREPQVLYSTDGGLTFKGPIAPKVPDKFTYRLTIPGAGVVLDTGTLLSPWWTVREPKDVPPPPNQRSQTLEVIASADGGETLGDGTVVSTLGSGEQRCRDSVSPAMDVDRSKGPFHGRVYLLWGDFRNGRCAALLALSTDNGKTWSKPVIVDDARRHPAGKGPDVMLPVLAVNRAGVVGIAWYDRREDPENRRHRLRFTASLDGGETFLPSIAASEKAYSFDAPERYPISPLESGGGRRRSREKTATFTTSVITAPRLYDGVGDTSGMAADANGVFHLFWTDNRTGVAQLFTSAATVAGTPVRNGARELTDLENVSERLEMNYTKSLYDPASRTVTLHVRFLNTSTDPIGGPLRLRATTLSSDLGLVRAVGADNHVEGIGAIWDLTAVVPGGTLEPGEWTEAKALVFEIQRSADFAGQSHVRSDRDPRARFVDFDSKVYGKPGNVQPAGKGRRQ